MASLYILRQFATYGRQLSNSLVTEILVGGGFRRYGTQNAKVHGKFFDQTGEWGSFGVDLGLLRFWLALVRWFGLYR